MPAGRILIFYGCFHPPWCIFDRESGASLGTLDRSAVLRVDVSTDLRVDDMKWLLFYTSTSSVAFGNRRSRDVVEDGRFEFKLCKFF